MMTAALEIAQTMIVRARRMTAYLGKGAIRPGWLSCDAFASSCTWARGKILAAEGENAFGGVGNASLVPWAVLDVGGKVGTGRPPENIIEKQLSKKNHIVKACMLRIMQCIRAALPKSSRGNYLDSR